MNMLKEYGTTKEELLSTISEAINLADNTDNGNLAERLMEVLVIIQDMK